MRSRLIAAGIIGLGFLAPASHAGAFFQFATPQSDYFAVPGEAVSVEIFLQESLTDGSPSELLLNQGLIGAGIRIDTLQIPSGNETASYLASLSQFIPSSSFMGGTGATPAFLEAPHAPSLVPPAYLLEFIDLDQQGVVGEPLSPTSRQVFLGTLILTAGAGGQTVFQATTVDSTTEDFVFFAGNPDPATIPAISPARFSLTVVPEPGLALPMLAAWGLLLKRRKS